MSSPYCRDCNAKLVQEDADSWRVVHELSCPLMRRPSAAMVVLLMILAVIVGALLGHQLDVLRGWM